MRKKILAALLAVCMVVSLLPAAALAATFDDVDDGLWAADAIERWAGYGVLEGKGDGKFDPSGKMTRAEFAKMLVTMLGLTKKSDKTFSDVDPDAWYAEVVSIAVAAGIINGRSADKFDPNAPVSFEEAAVMMCRAFGLAENKGGADWAKESIDVLTSLSMIGEDVNEHLVVGGECNRAVVAALADSIVAEYVNEDLEEPITGEIKGVILVVNGAKAEIKDATVIAPIVVESAEVTLTNTKADDVKVGGEKSVVAADEKSSVANVSIAGEEPAVEIKGEVTGEVTIEDGATGAVVDVPEDVEVKNESGNEATVNGETVEPEEKPEETEGNEGTTPAAGDEEEESKPGDDLTLDNPAGHKHNYVVAQCSDNANHKETCTSGTVDGVEITACGDVKYVAHSFVDVVEDGVVTGKKCTECEQVVAVETTVSNDEGAKADCEHEEMVEDPENEDVAATCTTAGTTYRVCADEECGYTETTTIPATGHNYTEVYVKATCGTTGERKLTCKNEGCEDVQTETIAATGKHTWDDGKITTPVDCTHAGEKTFYCKVCDTPSDAQPILESAPGHNWSAWKPVGGGSIQYKRVCKTDTSHEQTCDHTGSGQNGSYVEGVCNLCGAAEPEVEEHTWGDWEVDAESGKHVRSCTDDGCDETEEHTATTGENSDYERLAGKDTKHKETCGDCDIVIKASEDCADSGSDNACDKCGGCMHTETSAEHIANTKTHKVVCANSSCGIEITASVNCTEVDDTANNKAATCTEAGLTGQKVCSVCGGITTAGTVAPATDHDWSSKDGVCGTCNEECPDKDDHASLTTGQSCGTCGLEGE